LINGTCVDTPSGGGANEITNTDRTIVYSKNVTNTTTTFQINATRRTIESWLGNDIADAAATGTKWSEYSPHTGEFDCKGTAYPVYLYDWTQEILNNSHGVWEHLWVPSEVSPVYCYLSVGVPFKREEIANTMTIFLRFRAAYGSAIGDCRTNTPDGFLQNITLGFNRIVPGYINRSAVVIPVVASMINWTTINFTVQNDDVGTTFTSSPYAADVWRAWAIFKDKNPGGGIGIPYKICIDIETISVEQFNQ
jgi:hypothetical protein